MDNRPLVAMLIACSAVIGCARSGTEADRQAINQLREQEIALYSSGDVDKLLSLFTDDAVLMPPNESAVVGQQALRNWAQAMAQQFTVEGRYTSSADLTIAGDWAFERMAFNLKLTPKAGGAAIDDAGKGVHVYRRQSDGSWKIAQDIWNSDRAASTAGASQAQGIPDAITADPKHYKVDAENDVARILRITYGPGEKSVRHAHPASCAVLLDNNSFSFTLADGKVRTEPGQRGQVNCGDAEVHLPQNTGTTPTTVILVEFKNRQTFKP